jgi:hypothetical protein
MLLDHNIFELICKRKSCRSFMRRPIESPKCEQLSRFLKEASNTEFRFTLATRPEGPESDKIGAYGMVKNPELFIAGIVRKGADLVEFGAVFETIVLYAADMGLASCWLGASFDRKGFCRTLSIEQGETIPIVIAVGYELPRRITERFVRAIVRADSRKDWREIFFDNDFYTPLLPEKSGDFRVPLDMARIAPSAMNRQPWRIIRDREGFHFFISRTKGYAEKMGYDIQMIDMGIAISHFIIACRNQAIHGTLAVKDPEYLSEPLEYVRSFLVRS